MNHVKDLFTTLPNWIALLRMSVFPIGISFLISQQWFAVGLFAFLIGAASDWLDGYLARRWHQVTPVGKILDPLADKTLLWVTVWRFGFNGVFFWGVCLLFIIDMALLVVGAVGYLLFTIGRMQESAVGANIYGKIKFWCQSSFAASLFLIEIGVGNRWIESLGAMSLTALFAAVVFAVSSFVAHGGSFLRSRAPRRIAA